MRLLAWLLGLRPTLDVPSRAVGRTASKNGSRGAEGLFSGGCDVDVEAVSGELGTGEDARVLGWRRVQFERMGFSSENADLLAADTAVDVHRMRNLVAHGCPLDVAQRILT